MIPNFALVLSRICGAIILLPGMGETVSPATARVGLAVCITLLILPTLPDAGVLSEISGGQFLVAMIAEMVTGLWFGWLTRMVALVLPITGQIIGYLLGLSSVLQPDPDLGAQSNDLGTMLGLVSPLIFLVTGLYTLPITALRGSFDLIPLGHLLPPVDGTEFTVVSMLKIFSLSVQLAGPFVLVSIVWHLIMGHISRMASRMQIYFASIPGQILGGLALLMALTSTFMLSWKETASALLDGLPGTR